MASNCASAETNSKSKTKRVFKAMGRAVQNIFFAGNKVYDASALPETGSLEYPEPVLDEPVRIQKSTLEREKYFLYLTCILEKAKLLSAENKILKRKLQVILRRNGKFKIRPNVDLNNNYNKKWQSTENLCYQTESMKYCTQQDLRMLKKKKIENLVKEQGINSENLKRNINASRRTDRRVFTLETSRKRRCVPTRTPEQL